MGMANREATPQIAFIGLGAMGCPMAARLAGAGYALRVFDITPDGVGRFSAEYAARACGSALDAVQGADFVITMLPTSDEVEATLLGGSGATGVAEGIPPGACVIDMSSSEPLRTRRLARTLAGKGLVPADAPVSGGVKKARDGSLTIMFGGSEQGHACYELWRKAAQENKGADHTEMYRLL
jgi:3-hydroxyisobutyrate dehydrogenase